MELENRAVTRNPYLFHATLRLLMQQRPGKTSGNSLMDAARKVKDSTLEESGGAWTLHMNPDFPERGGNLSFFGTA